MYYGENDVCGVSLSLGSWLDKGMDKRSVFKMAAVFKIFQMKTNQQDIYNIPKLRLGLA